MSENWFEVGMKVRCIDGSWGTVGDLQKLACPNLPVTGGEYHIREIVRYTSGVFFLLKEVRNHTHPWQKGEPCFMAEKFRPLRKKTTSIEIFRAMLEPKKVEVVG
jgi:hypothetical protein